MFCTKCGKELQEGWKSCPFCGQEVSDHPVEIDEMISDGGNRCNNQTETGADYVHNEVKQYHFEGVRRTARFSFRRIPSDVEVIGNRIHVTTKGKKTVESEFSKQDVKDISLPLLPIMGMVDKVRIVLFALLMFWSYGLSAFALLFFIKITLIRHIKIELNDGRVIKIPIRQKADAAEFLRELSHPEEKIREIEKKAVSERKLSIREWIVSTVMLFIAAVTLVVGMEMYLDNQTNSQGEEIRQETTAEDVAVVEQDEESDVEDNITLEDYLNSCQEVTGEDLVRNPEQYIGKDILIEGKFNILMDTIVMDWFTDSGIIEIKYDGKAIDMQGNVVGNVMFVNILVRQSRLSSVA